MSNVAGKRLLILGGTSSTYDLVRIAKEMGIYTIVTDNNETGVAKEIADETAMVSTADIDGLVQLCKERNVDGVFTGASEFNIRNVIRVSEKAGLRCYTDMATWNNCAHKDTFKQFCVDFGIDCPQRYYISEDSTEAELAALDYPVIVKPVDGSSSIGITVCRDVSAVREACRAARSVSTTGGIIAEKFIENNRLVAAFKYLIKDGEPILVNSCDDYMVLDSKNPFNHMNSTPSKYIAYYLDQIDEKVKNMLKAMGLQNGTCFIQTLPYQGKLYFMEMGFRMSGGMMYKVLEPTMGVNDIRILLRYTLTGEGYTEEDVKYINLLHPRKSGGQFCIPLNAGTLARIEGLEESKRLPKVTDVLQYYYLGETVEERVIGTLGQQFCRFTVIADSVEEYIATADKIQKTIKVYDTQGRQMNTMDMDFGRLSAME